MDASSRSRRRSAAASLGRRDARIFIASSAIGSFGLGVAGFYLNFLYRALGLGETEIGALAAALALGGIFGALPAALLPRHLSRRGSVIVGGGVTATGLIGILSFESLGPLLASAAGLGAGGIVVASSGSALIADATSGSERSRMFGRQIALGTIAAFLAAFIAGALAAPVAAALGFAPADANTVRALIGGGGLVAALSAIPALMLAAPPVARGGHERAVRFRLLGRFLVLDAIFGFGAGSFLPFLNLFLADRFGLAFIEIGIAMGVIAVGGSLGAYLHARLVAARLGDVRGVVVVELASLPFAALAALAAGPLVAVIALAARAGLMYGASATIGAFTHASFAPSERAGAQAILHLAWAAGNAAAAGVSGLVRSALGPAGYTVNLFTLIAAYGLAAALTWVLFRAHEPRGDALAHPAPHSSP
ncbi:MAG TPA: MFS transporter [Candidatus Limnocylindria bacterium]|nr:MFS transporter [Candidatus Limnocylindria bacterium]